MKVGNILEICRLYNREMGLEAATTEAGSDVILPLVSVGHHHTRREDQWNEAIEVFSAPWNNRNADGARLLVGVLLDGLGDANPEADVRVAVPTDAGYHRVLSIHSVGFKDIIPGAPLTLRLDLEPWDSAHQTIRPD